MRPHRARRPHHARPRLKSTQLFRAKLLWQHFRIAARICRPPGLSRQLQGRYSWLAPPSAPNACCDVHCNVCPAPGHVLANISFIHSLAALHVISVAPLAAAFRMLQGVQPTMRTMGCLGPAPHDALSSFGAAQPWWVQFLSEAVHAIFA
jgi:hypothetical protein